MVQSNETRQHVTKSHPDKRTFLYRNLDYASEFSDQYPTVGGQTTRIVYAGLLGVAQGVYEICSAVEFEKLGVEFHIYGDGNEKNMIEQYISDNPNTNVFLA